MGTGDSEGFEELGAGINRARVRGWGGGGEGRSKVRLMRKSQFGNQEAQGFREETEVEGWREKDLGPEEY